MAFVTDKLPLSTTFNWNHAGRLKSDWNLEKSHKKKAIFSEDPGLGSFGQNKPELGDHDNYGNYA